MAVTRSNPSEFTGAKNPVENVSWDEAALYCKTLSGQTGRLVRLPTEAEWEYACRAGATTKYSFGERTSRLDLHGWHAGNSGANPHPVGQKKPNSWGLYDMHGNVWEWCADWYADSYASAGICDPKGPATGKCRVLRGGSWFTDAAYCGAAYRSQATPSHRHGTAGGLRVVVEVE